MQQMIALSYIIANNMLISVHVLCNAYKQYILPSTWVAEPPVQATTTVHSL